MDIKQFLIQHGEKFILGILVLLLALRLSATRVSTEGLPNLRPMIADLERNIANQADRQPDPKEIRDQEELVGRNWLDYVKTKIKYPLGDPAETFELPEDDWITGPRPKVPPPGKIEMHKPGELVAKGERGAVMLNWQGASGWQLHRGVPELGSSLDEASDRPAAATTGRRRDANAPYALYQASSAGVLRIVGFNIHRAPPGTEKRETKKWEKVNEKLLDSMDVLSGGAAARTSEAGRDARARPDGRDVPAGPDRDGWDERGMPAGPDMPSRTRTAAPTGRRTDQGPQAVTFSFLDRNVVPENKYVYYVEALAEVLRAQEVRRPEEYTQEQLNSRPKVGAVLTTDTDVIPEPVEVLSDTLIACMGGFRTRASIRVYKWVLDDEGRTSFATDRFLVRPGQEIGGAKTVTVTIPQAAARGREPAGGDPMDRPMDEMGPDAGMPPRDDMIRGGQRGRMPDDRERPGARRAAARRPTRRPDAGRARGRGGMGAGAATIKKEVDFSTGNILLDIVTESVEVELPERRDGDRTPRVPSRQQYKIIVVDRHNRLHEYWKMTQSEAEAFVREQTAGGEEPWDDPMGRDRRPGAPDMMRPGRTSRGRESRAPRDEPRR